MGLNSPLETFLISLKTLPLRRMAPEGKAARRWLCFSACTTDTLETHARD